MHYLLLQWKYLLQVNDKTFPVDSTIQFKDDLFLELVHDRNIASRIKNTTWTTKETQHAIWSSTCYCLLEYRDRFRIKKIMWETWIKDRQINPFKSLTSFINSNQFTVTYISSLRDSKATPLAKFINLDSFTQPISQQMFS